MSFERWIIDLVPAWVIDEGWLPHLALFAFLIGLRLLPIMIAGLCQLLGVVAKLFFAALLAILPAAAIGLGSVFAFVLTGAGRLALLVWFIALEARSGDAHGDGDGDTRAGSDAAAGSSGIAEACALLGLPEGGFTPDDLKRAYRRAIKQAHPDQGGNAADTMAILRARDRISEHFGWR